MGGGKWGEVSLMPHVYSTHTHTQTQPTVEGEACFLTGSRRRGDQLGLGRPGKFVINH